MMMDPLKKQELLRKNARWAPTPKQEAALCRPEREVGFGGSRGGGKTDGGIGWLGYDSTESRLRGLVIRKNSVDLGDWLLRAGEIHSKVVISGNPPVLRFPGIANAPGATYFTGHLKDKNSYSKYVGQNLARILFEELNLFPSEEQYEKILSSLRSPIPGIKAQAFTTFNPDNVGHSWIKKRFGLSGIPTENIITKDARSGHMRIFIPSRVDDNPYLMENDPEYVAFLEGLPDGLREQWRYGSWDDPMIKGAYYTMELMQARKDGRIGAVPYDLRYPVHTYWDIGNDMTAIIFVQFVGSAINIIDFYHNDDIGFPHYITELEKRRDEYHYSYGVHHFPHDMGRMEWGTGTARVEVIEQKDWEYEILPRVSVKQESIEAGRFIFPRVYIDQHKAGFLVDALGNYKKEWDIEKLVFAEKPVHDWASHPSDAFQQIGLSVHEGVRPDKSRRSSELLRKEIQDLGMTTEPQRPFSREFDAHGVETAYPQQRSRFHHPE